MTPEQERDLAQLQELERAAERDLLLAVNAAIAEKRSRKDPGAETEWRERLEAAYGEVKAMRAFVERLRELLKAPRLDREQETNLRSLIGQPLLRFTEEEGRVQLHFQYGVVSFPLDELPYDDGPPPEPGTFSNVLDQPAPLTEPMVAAAARAIQRSWLQGEPVLRSGSLSKPAAAEPLDLLLQLHLQKPCETCGSSVGLCARCYGRGLAARSAPSQDECQHVWQSRELGRRRWCAKCGLRADEAKSNG